MYFKRLFLVLMAFCTVCMAGCSSEESGDPNLIECGDRWINPQRDEEHCGGCGNACLEGERCIEGSCVLFCPPTQVECNGACFDLQTSEDHCGECDHPCHPAESCVAGSCVCSDGLESCDGDCVDTNIHEDHCGRCGNACAARQFCANATCYDPDVYGDGLVLVRQGASTEAYAERLASWRGWRFLAVETSDATDIQSRIAAIYDQERFRYLLLMGTHDELPMVRRYTEGWYAGLFQTDPSLYGDVDGDGFLELGVGRVPFSTPDELRAYFRDLTPRGGNYYLEHYPFAEDDPMDLNTVINYTYHQCINEASPAVMVSRFTEFAELRQRYLDATLLALKTHGSPDSFWINDHDDFTIYSLCPGCTRPYGCYCETPERLVNRPVLFHATCYNAQELGMDLLRAGASAFVGFYNPSGHLNRGFVQRLLRGASIGDSFRQLYNHHMVIDVAANLPGRNVVELDPGLAVDSYGYMLYGDPALRLPDPPAFNPSVTFEKHNGTIVLEAEPPLQMPLTDEDTMLCYTGEFIWNESVVSSSWWGTGTSVGESHYFFYTVSVDDAATLLSTTGFSGGVEVELGPASGEYRVNLVTGIESAVLLILLNHPELAVDETFRLEIAYQ